VLPLPPADFATRSLLLDVLPPGKPLYRTHELAHAPLWFGPGGGSPPVYRFDDPQGEFGVCYLGYTRMAAFVETMLRDLPTRVISEENLVHRRMSEVVVVADLAVVRAHSNGLVRLGSTAAIGGAKLQFPGATGADSYAHAMAWSRALHDHPDQPDGIAFHSSHDDALECIALFSDRASDKVEATGKSAILLNMRSLIANAVTRYGLDLIPRTNV
jgi:RES domain